MIDDLCVKVGPQYYRYAENAIRDIDKLLSAYQVNNILVVHGTVSWEKAEPYLIFLKELQFNVCFHRYSGECSYAEADRIVKIIKANAIDFVIGVGGGKLVDLVGYASNISNTNFGVVPTLASNCAPWTPLSVMYKENGQSEGITEHYFRQASFFVTDPRLIVDSPIDYFIAGIADTLAKWYESDLVTSQKHLQNESFIQLARHVALLCKDKLMAEGSRAIEDMKSAQLTDAFITCSEIIFAIAGLVGGFGDNYARNAAAHALHDGIGIFIEKSHDFLHGQKIAYGIFYQLALEDKWEVIDQLIPYYADLQLPTSMRAMGIFPSDEKVLDAIIDFMHQQPKVQGIPVKTDKKTLKEKLLLLEEYMCYSKKI